ncbi:MAG TPA: glycosyltransferase [Candidatus Saccharimonadales bacterium]|nr:glycosyltransferase [Candidatus Saccharimonadales bacterium]
MKIAVITCYDQNDHIRARMMRKGFSDVPGVETIIVRNKNKGLLRYLETPWKILVTRIKVQPDAWVITFRGYEMLPLVLLIKGRKPLIFDEMINAAEYLHEHKVIKQGSFLDKVFGVFYGTLLKRCRFILADTDAHADLSAELSKVDRKRYVTVPIGTEEALFYPDHTAAPNQPGKFEVFYYGVMTKLHGLDTFLEAAAMLASHPDIVFRVGGDKGKSKAKVEAAVTNGAHITYHDWFEYKQELPRLIRGSQLMVGGPFGGSAQAQFVITTKTFQGLACEVPVLIGRNKVNDAFVDIHNSLVVPQGNAKAIAEAILWAYLHPKQLHNVAKAGRQLYEQEFSDTQIAFRLTALVKGL